MACRSAVAVILMTLAVADRLLAGPLPRRGDDFGAKVGRWHQPVSNDVDADKRINSRATGHGDQRVVVDDEHGTPVKSNLMQLKSAVDKLTRAAERRRFVHIPGFLEIASAPQSDSSHDRLSNSIDGSIGYKPPQPSYDDNIIHHFLHGSIVDDDDDDYADKSDGSGSGSGSDRL